MNSPLTSTSEVIDALGGTAAVARMLNAKMQSVSNWRATQTFPPQTYVAIKAELRKIDRDAPDSLWRMLGTESPIPAPEVAA